LVSQNTCQFCLVTIHRHVNSDHPTTDCCPSQQTTQCSPAVCSAQLHLVFGTVDQLPFEHHPLPTLFDDTSRLTFSPATSPSTNCYHPCPRFELLFWQMAHYKYRLLTYLLTFWGRPFQAECKHTHNNVTLACKLSELMPKVCPAYMDTMALMQHHWMIAKSTTDWSNFIH